MTQRDRFTHLRKMSPHHTHHQRPYHPLPGSIQFPPFFSLSPPDPSASLSSAIFLGFVLISFWLFIYFGLYMILYIWFFIFYMVETMQYLSFSFCLSCLASSSPVPSTLLWIVGCHLFLLHHHSLYLLAAFSPSPLNLRVLMLFMRNKATLFTLFTFKKHWVV